jgi:hypothetical protein
MQQYMTTGIWQGYYASGSPVDFAPNTHGTGYWDAANGNPIADVARIRSQVKGRTGFKPNKMVVTDNVHNGLMNNAVILDRIKYTQRGVVTEDLLAALFGVEQYIVAGAVFNSAQEGTTANMGYMANNCFLLGLRPRESPGLRKPVCRVHLPMDRQVSAPRPWAPASGSSAWRHLESDRVEVEMGFQMAQTCRDLGVLGVSVLQNP